MTALTLDRSPRVAPVTALVAFFAAAVAVRAALTGPPGPGGGAAPSLLFAGLLAAAVLAVGTPTRFGRRIVVVGVLAGAAVVVPALIVTGARHSLPVATLPAWAAVTALVATAEEAFLRGVLFDAVARRAGVDVAIAVAAVGFGLMHVPFYGWPALPLDTAVGVALGVARVAAGSWTAPALAHVGADLAGWWLL